MRKSVLKRREKRRKQRLLNNSIEVDFSYPKTPEELSNELLYTLLSSRVISDTLRSHAIGILTDRVRPVIFSRARKYYRLLGWSRDDAIAEAMELIWILPIRRPYRTMTNFNAFFGNSFEHRLLDIYRRMVRHHPDIGFRVLMGYSGGEPVYYDGGMFNKAYIDRLNKR